jgi:hypothetical protein
MSVARCLGVDDLDAPNMREAAAQWPRWQEAEPTLDVVDDVHDLPRWMKRADPVNRDAVASALLRLGAIDKRASTVLAWLLVPGASLLAGRLRNLVDAIDEVVAGQLWIQICDHDPSDDQYVAKKILSRVEREVKAELGVGDLAERRDPAWAATVLVEQFDESIPAYELAEEFDNPREQLTAILRRALDDGDLTEARRDPLLDLAHAANLLKAPLRRGRAGLTAPSVAQMVCDDHALSARTVRRNAANDLDVLASVARRPGLAV